MIRGKASVAYGAEVAFLCGDKKRELQLLQFNPAIFGSFQKCETLLHTFNLHRLHKE